MIGIEELYLLNLIVTVGMFVVLIIRAWIERKHTNATLNNMEARRQLREIYKVVCAERDEIKKMNKKELQEFLEHLMDLLSE